MYYLYVIIIITLQLSNEYCTIFCANPIILPVWIFTVLGNAMIIWIPVVIIIRRNEPFLWQRKYTDKYSWAREVIPFNGSCIGYLSSIWHNWSQFDTEEMTRWSNLKGRYWGIIWILSKNVILQLAH